jgi:hypothetical protein
MRDFIYSHTCTKNDYSILDVLLVGEFDLQAIPLAEHMICIITHHLACFYHDISDHADLHILHAASGFVFRAFRFVEVPLGIRSGLNRAMRTSRVRSYAYSVQ